jgi:putative oxidoreductase
LAYLRSVSRSAWAFRSGRRHALAAGFVETPAGLLLAFGLLMPLAATASLSVMIVAAVSVHGRHSFFIMDSGLPVAVLGAIVQRSQHKPVSGAA